MLPMRRGAAVQPWHQALRSACPAHCPPNPAPERHAAMRHRRPGSAAPALLSASGRLRAHTAAPSAGSHCTRTPPDSTCAASKSSCSTAPCLRMQQEKEPEKPYNRMPTRDGSAPCAPARARTAQLLLLGLQPRLLRRNGRLLFLQARLLLHALLQRLGVQVLRAVLPGPQNTSPLRFPLRACTQARAPGPSRDYVLTSAVRARHSHLARPAPLLV